MAFEYGKDFLLIPPDDSVVIPEGWEAVGNDGRMLVPKFKECEFRKITEVRKESCNCVIHQINCTRKNKVVTRQECRDCKGV
jgi:hypothetical protein